MIQPMRIIFAVILLASTIVTGPVLADVPVVENVVAVRTGDAFRFDVTIRHPDTGWDHYADAWEVLAPDGTRLGLRELAHPHEDEQPFTRSLEGVTVPSGIDHVLIRARCSVDGWATDTVRVDLP